MLRFSGYSDDNVRVDGMGEIVRSCPTCGADVEEPSQATVSSKSSDEIGCYDEDVVFNVGDKLMVTMCYRGAWGAYISQIEEDVKIPWDVSVKTNPENWASVFVEVDCPDGTILKWKKRPAPESS